MAFTFRYNDFNSVDEGLFIENIPSLPSFSEDDNLYTIVFAYKLNSDDNLMTYMKLKTVFSEGGILTTSLSSNTFLKVESVIFKEIEKNKNFVVNSVTFILEPYIYISGGDKVININKTGFKLINNYSECKPRVKVNGAGKCSLIINSNIIKVDITQGYMIIDSELKDVFSSNGLLTNFFDGKFPTLLRGTNTINFSGGITSIEIIPNWRC